MHNIEFNHYKAINTNKELIIPSHTIAEAATICPKLKPSDEQNCRSLRYMDKNTEADFQLAEYSILDTATFLKNAEEVAIPRTVWAL